MLSCPVCDGDELDRGTLTVSPPDVPVRCIACGHEWVRTPLGAAISSKARKDDWGLHMDAGSLVSWFWDPSSLPPGDLRQLNRQDPSQVLTLQKLKGLALGPKVLNLVRTLVTEHLPRYRNREQQFWTLTALPSTSRNAHHQRLFTLSVSNVEVAWAGYDPKTGEDTGGSLYVRSAPLKEGSERRLQQSCGAGVRLLGLTHTYAAEEEATIVFASLDQARALLEDQIVSDSLRQRTADLMSEGQVPSVFRRFHNAAFAAQVMAGAETR
jgi:hypothetical protein